jgi:hypothetical protein
MLSNSPVIYVTTDDTGKLEVHDFQLLHYSALIKIFQPIIQFMRMITTIPQKTILDRHSQAASK